MASDGALIDDAPAAAVLPVGRVSALLGIPAMTLRSWEARYGLSPSSRTAGQHRRYTVADVDRFRRMQRLIAAGISAADAARLSTRPESVEDLADGQSLAGQRLLDVAESLALGELADLLDDCLTAYGAARAWTEVIAPAFRMLGSRYEQQQDCTDLELILARAVEGAVERYLQSRRLRADGPAPTFLVHCPQDRHTMPMTILRAVLLERGQPVVLLDPDMTEPAVLQAIARGTPYAVVLWASVRRPGQLRLRNLVAATGVATLPAGPGWPPSAAPLTDLQSAAIALALPA
ncbi:MerR family transcriptional regulator [Kribbella sp. CA-293567]|uniref:MerR family transcriptional regulator n=1 Tax=Kribbella sp. CA-293567 TaxID=3002436 RepID=UPI0022DE6DEC|nr:MerR family transcriptional regulator [Kribbella sp. CA-293567]WBQ03477.1 MerR family transcriptional regulator [Kribbella sp. CA-293567]